MDGLLWTLTCVFLATELQRNQFAARSRARHEFWTTYIVALFIALELDVRSCPRSCRQLYALIAYWCAFLPLRARSLCRFVSMPGFRDCSLVRWSKSGVLPVPCAAHLPASIPVASSVAIMLLKAGFVAVVVG